MNWRLPRFLIMLLIVCVVIVVCIGGIIGIVVIRSEHAQAINPTVIPQKTVIPRNEQQVVNGFNQDMVKQDWKNLYASTASIARGGHSQEEFIQLAIQQVEEQGSIASITPISNISNPEIKTISGLTAFSISEKVVKVKDSISETASYSFVFILENGIWKFFTSTKI